MRFDLKSQKIKIKYFTDTKCIFRHHFMYKNLDKLSRVHLGKFFQEHPNLHLAKKMYMENTSKKKKIETGCTT